MDQNEENTLRHPQALFLKYFLETLQKQQTRSSEISPVLTEQSVHRKSNDDFLSQFANQIQQASMASPVVSDPSSSKKRYQSDTSSTDCTQDETYRERRKKNNEAAKRSRDARRVKEDHIALRATWLEQENLQLRLENTHLKQENIQLRSQLSDSTDL